MFIYMLSNINLEDNKDDIFTKKYNWFKAMPYSRKKNIKKLYYYNPEDEEKCNKIIKLFPNLRFVKTNFIKNRLIANYITTYDLIIINNLKEVMTRDFIIEQVQNLTENGKIWLFCNNFDELNIIIEEIEEKLGINLEKFKNKYNNVKSVLDELSTNYFETKIEYSYDVHKELYKFITKRYLSLESKLQIKSYLESTFSNKLTLTESIFMIG